MRALHKLSKALRVLWSRDRRWLRALWWGVAPSLEHLPVLGLMRPEMVVDIGANRGQFALAVRHIHPRAHVVSFEPLAKPAATYRSIFAGQMQVTLHEAAIGPQAGVGEIHVSKHDDSSSLLPMGEAQDRLFPGTVEVGRQSVRVARLADHVGNADISAPALLKLDVQGFELSALQGCEDLLDRFAWIYVECSFLELYQGQALADEVIAWLRERGFVLRGVYNMTYDRDGRAVQADFLFARLSLRDLAGNM